MVREARLPRYKKNSTCIKPTYKYEPLVSFREIYSRYNYDYRKINKIIDNYASSLKYCS